ncbi:hypothetical protein CEXT_364751 [Caerostris extrusa]|uniref:Uncharacterized protein n=1 Tax=Caerostris extrusa TaxID=172846 RepID=A0AAV4X9I6_CAEEX|nr:hypothetical protein CEXT_364751 [Caerostris extrusa]
MESGQRMDLLIKGSEFETQKEEHSSLPPSQTTRVFFFPEPQQGTDFICRTKTQSFSIRQPIRRDASPDQHDRSDRSAGLLTISPLSEAISPRTFFHRSSCSLFSMSLFAFLANDLH